MKISTKDFPLGIATLITLLWAAAAAFAGPYPGTVKNHGHSRSGDGGTITNLTISTRLTVGTSSMTSTSLGALWNYRRPPLEYGSDSMVYVATNSVSASSAPANTTSLVFNDGTVFTVAENVGSSQKYRVLNKGIVASWGSSDTIRGGMYLSTATMNRRYAVYAVKVSSTGLTDKFVLVGSTLAPVPQNFPSLNFIFGSNSWLYLGALAHGDGGSAPNSWCKFYQEGNRTYLANAISSGDTANGVAMPGIQFTRGASIALNKWTYSVTPSSISVLENFGSLYWHVLQAASGGGAVDKVWTNAASTYQIIHSRPTGTFGMVLWWPAAEGISTGDTVPNAHAQDLNLIGWEDRALGPGLNTPW